jgi:hypothetical protein
MANRAITFADGNTLTAANMTQLQKQAVINCDAAVDYPGTPARGQFVYNVALDQLLQYTTVTTTWKPPWNLPWGYITSASITANSASTSGTTVLAVTGLSVTWTAVANRRYLISANLAMAGTVGTTDLIDSYIADGALASKVRRNFVAPALVGGAWYQSVHLESYETGLSGSITRQVAIARNAGTGTAQIAAAATSPALILVTDLGPSAAPA